MTDPRALLWTDVDARDATDGVLRGASWRAFGVSIDSRTVQPGDLFIALVGPNFDGHGYVADALAKGAAAAVVTDTPDGIDAAAPLLVVTDTMNALTGLARAARARTAAKVIAVTGSVGKTGTKDMLRLVLSKQGATHATEGNLNNHWGLPLTLARMPQNTRYAVLEMGMNHAGELAPLSQLARPDVAIVTTVEAVHSEHFASVEAIADAKGEIFAGLAGGGTAVLNGDNPHFDRLAAAAGNATVVSFGEGDGLDMKLTSCTAQTDGVTATARVTGHDLTYTVGVAGRHWAINALAALAAVDAVGADVTAAAQALAEMRAPAGRGAHHTVRLDDGALDVIDESYNASPTSMTAALAVLGARTDADRRVAVLGDMLELGTDSEARHAALVPAIEDADVTQVFTCGAHMHDLFEALPQARRGGHAATAETLVPMVTDAARAGDVIMVKGSAGSRTGVIVAALLALGPGGDAHAV